MMHLLIVCVNGDVDTRCIINDYTNSTSADQAARAYLQDHPEDTAHVYAWAGSYSAARRVEITRQYSPPERPPEEEFVPIATGLTD